MTDRFEGQIAVVTGGADGIGKAIAERLAREGARVTILDLDEVRGAAARDELAARGQDVSFIAADVAQEEPIAQAIQQVVARHGRLDVLVHCAAIVGPNGVKVTEVSAEDFDQVYRINLRSSYLVTKHAIRAMEQHDYGRVLLFASIAGKEGNAGMSAYSMSKAGVIGLVKSVGKEFAETGITVNAITPAVIRTGMVASMDPAQVTYMTDKIPMQRCGTLDEIAAFSCWIVSRESSFNTANVFDMTGGRATY